MMTTRAEREGYLQDAAYSIPGYCIVSQPEFLRHFSAQFEPVNGSTDIAETEVEAEMQFV